MTDTTAPTRDNAIETATSAFDDGRFFDVLAARVAVPSESQNPDRSADLDHYIEKLLWPDFEAMGFTCRILNEPKTGAKFLLAERIEGPEQTTVLCYGHGDVVRGMDDKWTHGNGPWNLTLEDGRFYGRGAADNKGQHSINMAGLEAVIATRGNLGFNMKMLIEMGEETGSPGLRELCTAQGDVLAADLLIASDGPRLSETRPTVFLGARGAISFDLVIDARDGAHHSGNWGGLLSNPAVQLSHAIASLVGPTGQIRVPDLVPDDIPDAVRKALQDCAPGEPGGPTIDTAWGETGLTPAERVFGWNALEVLAFEAGTPAAPVNAIPGRAWARLQLRFVVGTDPAAILPAVQQHLTRQGLGCVEVRSTGEPAFGATRLDPEDPWVDWTLQSIQTTTGKRPALLPNLGGGLPNDAFSDILGMRTIWIPHSYPGCAQHAPDEHLPASIAREGLAIMAGLFWDLGEKAL